MSQYYYVPSVIIGSVGIYYGYYYVRSYLQKYIMDQVMTELNKKQDGEAEIFKPLEKSKSAIILYSHGGKNHKVCVPYDRSKSRNMLRKQVFLIRTNENEDEQWNEITHKPGIPYLLSAKDMGGIKIIIVKDGETIKEYSEDEIPNYLD